MLLAYYINCYIVPYMYFILFDLLHFPFYILFALNLSLCLLRE